MSLERVIIAAMLAAASLFGTSLARAQCASDSECKGGRVCREGACVEAVQSCSTDIDCSGDLICVAGTCSQPGAATSAPPIPPPESAHHTSPHAAGTPSGPRQDQAHYQTKTRGITSLIITGPIVFGISYATTIGVAAGLNADEELIRYSAIPLAGPWVMLGTGRVHEDYAGMLAVDGILQAGGLTMFIIGVSVRREYQVPVYASDDGRVRVGLSAAPSLGGSILSASGHF